ncbi:TPM domain-containing protein [Microbacterium sp. NPDC076911]|uniref:TPM domain-containing protein n=1 Tax=Microbacterium sp. NPDC076911 TaxID=3154958 RepID=UPI0034122433
MRTRWAAMLAATVAVGLTLASGAASATDPVPLSSGYVLDDAGVLSSSDAADGQSRLEELKSDTGVDLWVVYVDEFTNPSDSADWANETAQANGLGPTQYLMAVAVDSRQYYISGDSEGPVTFEQLASIEQEDVQPALADDDWAGAIDAAADGFTSAVNGTSSSGTSNGSGGWFFPLLLGIVVVGGIIYLLVWFARRRKRTSVGAGVDGTSSAEPPVSIEELQQQASSSLIETDDALKTSAQELGFARAQFGDEATESFEQTLAKAKQNLDDAFALKQQLDDEVPDAAADVRSWNTRIIELCDEANKALDAKAAEFDELRKLEQNAPDALVRVQKSRDAVVEAVDIAAAHLASLELLYAPQALATIADNPTQASTRIAFADEQIAAASAALTRGDGGEAAVGIRAAEEAVGQAALLEEAIEKLTADLAAAEQRSVALIAELESDMRTAATLPDSNGHVAAVIAATGQQIAAARASLGEGGKRPLVAMQSLEAANTEIDSVVQQVRDAAANAQRARAQVGEQILQAQAQVSATEDFITARRGAVGAEARTRLAEAGASLIRAQGLQNSDPEQALGHAQRANQLAAHAAQLAQNDVGAFQTRSVHRQGGGGNNMMGAMLGGIVINSLLGGGGRSSRGYGGMGRTGGGSRSRSRSTGSFGGGGTRGRRGGGRF